MKKAKHFVHGFLDAESEGLFIMNSFLGDFATANAIMLSMLCLFPFSKIEASFLLFHEKSQALCAWLSCCGE
jgi:hypothetical protein